MRIFQPGTWICALACACATVSMLDASSVMQLNLAQMVQRAHRIYRGTVVSVTAGTIEAGGGQLPTVTYRLRVDDVLRGDVETVKGVRLAEVRMIGKITPARRGSLRAVNPLPDMPTMVVGDDYLVMTTRPGASGLSTTVGLGQGCFRISALGKNEVAVNMVNNSGLFRGMTPPPSMQPNALLRGAQPAEPSGPIAYGELAGMIQSLARQ
jgi:hypothetical protein